MINLDYLQKLDKTNIPNAKNLTEALKSPIVGPEPRLLTALAVGCHRHRVRRGPDR